MSAPPLPLPMSNHGRLAASEERTLPSPSPSLPRALAPAPAGGTPTAPAAALAVPRQTQTDAATAAHPGLDHFNSAPAEDARALLLDCLASARWARRLVEHRPYPDLEALLAASDEAAYDLRPAELHRALAAEESGYPAAGDTPRTPRTRRGSATRS